jgi:hypothetical protein
LLALAETLTLGLGLLVVPWLGLELGIGFGLGAAESLTVACPDVVVGALTADGAAGAWPSGWNTRNHTAPKRARTPSVRRRR